MEHEYRIELSKRRLEIAHEIQSQKAEHFIPEVEKYLEKHDNQS